MTDLQRYYLHIRRVYRHPPSQALADARRALSLPKESIFRKLLLGYREP